MLLPASRYEYGGCGDAALLDYALKVAFVYDMNMWQFHKRHYAKYHRSKDCFIFGDRGGVFLCALTPRPHMAPRRTVQEPLWVRQQGLQVVLGRSEKLPVI